MKMPAEWEPHEATWLSWPKNLLTFPKEVLPQVEEVYLQIIEALYRKEKVHLLVDDEKTKTKVQKLLEENSISKNVHLHEIVTGDVWFRDYGPIFVKNSQMKMTKWLYNAYGGKYDDLLVDNGVVDKIAPIIDMEIYRPEIMLEGGSIEVNGAGSLITTEQCLLNENRNKQLNRQQIEKYLQDYLGVNNIVWLGSGIVGDDTDGHIDDMVRFASEKTVLAVIEGNKKDENYKPLMDNLRMLKSAKDQDGQLFDVRTLPMPAPLKTKYGRLPASYANFYIANGVVLLPVFADKKDDLAISIMEEVFPSRKIVPINCTSLVHGFGGIHCVTQQQPK